MKKITLMFMVCIAFAWQGFSQTLNQNASWPNVNWTVTGTYSTAAGAVEGDPTVDANFAFDDDDAGNPSDDNIAAESPVIDLTAAFTAGEFWLTVSAEYVYYYLADDELVLQYWDADGASWVNWGPNFDTLGTTTSIFDDFCSGTPQTFTSEPLDIAAFTATQQSGFRYRIAYDDNPAGGDWNYGFCFQSPTITSAIPPTCIEPSNLMASITGIDTVDFSWTAGDTETDWTYEYGVSPYTQGGGGTSGTVMTTPSLSLSGLTAGETYDIYVQANCGANGDSTYITISWTQPNLGESCSAAFAGTVEADCAAATPLSLDFDAGGSETLPSCDLSGNNGYWVEITTPANGSMNINLGGTATGVGLAIYETCGGSEIFCANNTLGATTELTGFAGSTTYYLYFWQDTAGGVAEVCFEEISCVFPSNLNVDVTSTTTADISWVENNTPASTSWEYVIQAQGTGEPAGAGTATSNNPTSISGLTDAADYEFYVRADCGGSFSVWSGPFTWSQILPPSNDDCANAEPLTVNTDLSCGTVTSGTTVAATASAEDTTGTSGTPNNDVWFSFVATGSDHSVSLSNVTAVVGTSTDMGMAVYDATGGCGALVFEATSDPNSLSLSGLTAGTTYYLRVYGWSSSATATAQTTFDVCVGTPPTPPANDECANAEALTVNADLSCGVVTAGTTVSATESAEDATGTSGTPNNDVWFSFVAAGTDHTVSLSNVTAVIGTSTDMGMAVYDATGGCGALVFEATSDPNTLGLSGLTAGTTYYLRVYGWSSSATGTAQTTFDVCVGTPPAPPANDDCANATSVAALPYTFTQDASGATNNAGFIDPTDASCSGNGMNDGVWYTFTATATGTVNIAITNVVGWDPEVAIYSGACGAFICEGRADSAGASGDESLTDVDVTSGVQYWINVGYYSDFSDSSEGPFQIDISDVTLGIDDLDNQSAFTYYPNPVKNTLTLNAQNTIESVSMYNMLGQEVLRATPNALESDLDMSSLQTGTYFVKVTIANVTETIRVIKE